MFKVLTLFTVLTLGSSAFAISGNCTAEAKCSSGQASCSAHSEAESWGSIDATCANNNRKFLSCTETWNPIKDKQISHTTYICCDGNGSAFSTNVASVAAQVCVGY